MRRTRRCWRVALHEQTDVLLRGAGVMSIHRRICQYTATDVATDATTLTLLVSQRPHRSTKSLTTC